MSRFIKKTKKTKNALHFKVPVVRALPHRKHVKYLNFKKKSTFLWPCLGEMLQQI